MTTTLREHLVSAPRHAPLRLVEPTASQAIAPDSPAAGQRWARRYRAQLQATDALVIATAIAATLAFTMTLGTGGVTPALLASAGAIAVIWLAALAAQHTRDARVVGVGATEYRRIVNATLLSFGIFGVVVAVTQVPSARAFFLVALPLGAFALLFERWLWRKWLLRQRRNGHYLSRAIVIGSRDEVEYVVARLQKEPGAGYAPVGAALPSGSPALGSFVPIIGTPEGAADAAKRLGVDAVIVAGVPQGGNEYVRRLGWELERTDAELVLSNQLADIAGPRIHFRPVEGMPLIHVEIPHFEGGRHVFKRAVDILLSTLALIVLMPVLAAIAIAIKLDGPGPVIFRQRRVGRQGESFEMLKFRSMVETAEDDLAGLLDRSEGNGVLFKMRNDPRVTRVGRVLRKYSLDELPQIWNILVGDMSIVGPRPPLPREVEEYEGPVERRLFIRPGLTGMWQINGRSDLSWEESVRLDLYYVENWSLTGDLMIIWRTFKAVMRPVGAY